jgi:hypothetical protein
LPRLLIETSSRIDMITLRIGSAPAVTTRPVPWWCHPAMAQTATRTSARGCYPARAGGPWLRRTLVLSGFQAMVVPSA